MGCFLMLQNPGLARYCGEAWVFSERALSVLSNAIITWACFCSTEIQEIDIFDNKTRPSFDEDCFKRN